MYVNGIFAKNMSKHHIFPICDALALKVLITRKLVFSLMINMIFMIFLLSTWLPHLMQRKKIKKIKLLR